MSGLSRFLEDDRLLHGQVDDSALRDSAGGSFDGHRRGPGGGKRYCVAGVGAAGDKSDRENQDCVESEEPDVELTTTGEGKDCAEGEKEGRGDSCGSGSAAGRRQK